MKDGREDESIKARTSGKAGMFPSSRALIKQSGRNVLLGFLSVLLRIRAGAPVSPRPGDLLLMPDMFWGSGDPIRAAAVFTRKGGAVVPVIHDLIPLQFPEYCHEGTVYSFCRTLPDMVNLASGILTVSRTVSRDLKDYLADRFPDRSLHAGVFYPGADMILKGSPALPVRSEFERAGIGDPFYLMVGSIQPHKGHLVVLETFERLWDQGFPGKLFILGRLGGRATQC